MRLQSCVIGRCARAALLLGALAAGCARPALPPQDGAPAQPVVLSEEEAQALREGYQRQRRDKDLFFLDGADSPLADAFRRGFGGLDYFPVDLRYRFRGPIHRFTDAEQFRIMSNTGELRQALHWGYFRFPIDGQIHTLQVYKMLDAPLEHGNSLFLPFIDAGAGKTTYGAGRYLDLEENPEGIYTVDFNAAYNPYCAYGKAYSCPMAPRENRLRIAIPAGEKMFRGGLD